MNDFYNFREFDPHTKNESNSSLSFHHCDLRVHHLSLTLSPSYIILTLVIGNITIAKKIKRPPNSFRRSLSPPKSGRNIPTSRMFFLKKNIIFSLFY